MTIKRDNIYKILIKHILFVSIFALCISTSAQIPYEYYNSANNLYGNELKNEMHNIIKNHITLSYNSLWQHFKSTDKRPDNDKVWDVYSDIPGGIPSYFFSFGIDQCGSYSAEGNCYNREHSIPKSWFGGEIAPMYTDIFHLYPTDGFVNSKRSNLPLGKVDNATWTSSNGSKVGPNVYSDYSGTVFEPIDSFKGDFARTYMYMVVCYKNKNLSVETQSMFNYNNGECTLKPWAQNMLLEWCAMDPVSKKEIDRNNAIYQIQGNRNPFIDFPELAEMLFGSDTNSTFTTNISAFQKPTWNIYPNPTSGKIIICCNDNHNHLNAEITIFDIIGNIIYENNNFNNDNIDLNSLNIANGLYFLRIESNNNRQTIKIIKQ